MEKKFLIIAGPCVLEDFDTAFYIANFLKELISKYEFDYVFKASFDKANRTSLFSYRGPGLEKGLSWLEEIKKNLDIKVTTDVHETWQVKPVSEVVDIIQIPAFLCRQTDLVVSASQTGKIINIKKGQFMSPWDMKYVLQKAQIQNPPEVLLTERGYSFGYRNLVVDFRSIPIMKSFGVRVIFDATHSVQLPGGGEGKSGGEREFVPYLIRAAVVVGADGIFMEVHPEPDKALCDGPNSLPLSELEKILQQIKDLRAVVEKHGIS
ncbi:MAG: 3-deoxy-8-phosphooctulonate synthase [Thermodesulfobacterium geofontis]|uniref:2-dehydro-3-deoxyphosphooctonate aldolase n=1 Tax=Thermodesulfobacterium geofontis TaxID=1295609 RepID=A0A2N7PN86_9BACT|nr:MAG: 3-deoxy-8-phosphooctulonate synthase [Thermodesulfobacterium geofontis]PMP98191.1 MAG: 3-deoxy-8-phosphooctulonate synthase [Thermodesulfobacterium geofontis]